MKKYLDLDGLRVFWGRIKLHLNKKVDKENGKGLSTNDFTDQEKEKLKGLPETFNWEDIGNKPDVATKDDITRIYNLLGEKANTSELPTEGNEIGDTYYITEENKNYFWDGEKWVAMAESFRIDSITSEEIDAVMSEDTTVDGGTEISNV